MLFCIQFLNEPAVTKTLPDWLNEARDFTASQIAQPDWLLLLYEILFSFINTGRYYNLCYCFFLKQCLRKTVDLRS